MISGSFARTRRHDSASGELVCDDQPERCVIFIVGFCGDCWFGLADDFDEPVGVERQLRYRANGGAHVHREVTRVERVIPISHWSNLTNLYSADDGVVRIHCSRAWRDQSKWDIEELCALGRSSSHKRTAARFPALFWTG